MTLFDSRTEAAHRLADALETYRGTHPLVLAIPRGAVGMGRIIADRLGGDLDVVLVRKLGAPGNPELAVGAIDESGAIFVAEHAGLAGADPPYLETERARQSALLQNRRALYTPAREPLDPQGRITIIVDDGLATGATMIAALHATRARNPARLVCAVPIAAPESLDAVRPLADELVCLDAPAYFMAVGQFYRDFPQVTDAEVVALLRETRSPHGRPL
ncbi:MAG: phosphoribosyltransferase [Rhodocyclaceae bacterium]|nr:phosphoribosyltransferase [Rhodocyclaceae bacterium]